ncbi:MAG: ATP-binding protein [Candidatus Margulisiibacteriota bacterium]
MLSTVTIISIFIEMFAAGILLAGAFSLFKKFTQQKQVKDLYSCSFFLAFFFYVAATVASQMMLNLGMGLAELIQIHKAISVGLILCIILLWCFIFERINARIMRWTFVPILLGGAFFVYQIIISSVNLIYREGILEPVVLFSQIVPGKPLFAIVCLMLAIFSIIYALRKIKGERILALWLAAAGLLYFLSMLFNFFYIRFGESAFLLGVWLLLLLATLVFLLAEIIPPDSPEAIRPLRFLRTRLLFKLLLIFVLLIVILFEATTLATINISKQALSKSIINSYLRTAEEMAEKINLSPKQPSHEYLQKLVSETKGSSFAFAFIVDKKGTVIAHPDEKLALQHENILSNESVRQGLANPMPSGGEFMGELGKWMVGAYVPISKYGWLLVVQEPMNSAYFEMRRLETNSLLFVIAGIILTTMVGIFFASSLERPVKELTIGTEAVARGDLHWKIAVDSSDEIGKLAVAFNQMTKDLRDSQERLILSEKLASLGTMAAGMAHEIKNPLVSLRTFTQLLQQKWDDKEFRDKFSKIIPTEIERINRIAESLLKFGRPMKPELTQADVNSLLDEVLLLFESETKKYNVRVTKKFAQIPEVTGDAGQLQQVFVNIVKNAIEAMHEKGGELIVKTDVGEVIKLGKVSKEGNRHGEEMVWGEGEEELTKPQPVVFIEVTDSGEGIPEDHLKSLFDPFFTTKMTGTGMGLPITLRIIEEHGGSIKVRSQEGKGTTFIITLPIKNA